MVMRSDAIHLPCLTVFKYFGAEIGGLCGQVHQAAGGEAARRQVSGPAVVAELAGAGSPRGAPGLL